MGRTPNLRLAPSAGGSRVRERPVPGIRSASLRADTAGGRSLREAPFVPDLFLPEQAVAGVRRDSTMCGEKALLLAVLTNSIRCFLEHRWSHRPSPRALTEEAEAWITTGPSGARPCGGSSRAPTPRRADPHPG